MKKLILMLLLVVGGVMTVSAATVTRRIVVEHDMDSWTEWKSNDLYVHIFTEGFETSWGTKMTFLGGYTNNNSNSWRRMFYYDITADESIFSNQINVWFYNEKRKNSDSNDNNNNTYNRCTWTGTIGDKGMFFYLYPDGTPKTTTEEITYYFVNTDGNAKLADLTYNNGVLTGTYQNSGETYATIAPEYALNIYGGTFSGIRNYQDFTISPSSDADINVAGFNSFNGNLGGTKAFKFSDNFTYDLEFDIFNKTYSITPYFERTLNAAAEGYATFSSTYDVTVPSGLTASYVTAVENGKITWYNVNSIKAGKGALLKGEAGKTYKFTPATDADESTDLMVAIPNEVQLAQATNSGIAYILTKVNNKLGFYKVNSAGSWVNAGTAYLDVPTAQAREFYLFDDNTTTSIEAVESTKMEGPAYNLNGQRIAQPTKGLYIVNGKKVIMK